MVLPTAYFILGLFLIALGLWVGGTAGHEVIGAMRQNFRASLLVVGPIGLGIACVVMAIRSFLGAEGPSSRAAERAKETDRVAGESARAE